MANKPGKRFLRRLARKWRQAYAEKFSKQRNRTDDYEYRD